MTTHNIQDRSTSGLSILDEHLPVYGIYLVVRTYMLLGRVIPQNKKRHSDCFVCIYSGRAIYYFSTHTITVSAGDILYIAKGSTYCYDVLSERYEYIYVDFDFLFPSNMYGISERFSMKNNITFFQALFERLNHRWHFKAPGSHEQCFSDFYQIYAKLVWTAKAQYASVESRAFSEMAAAYIEKNCTNPQFKITQVAQAMGCSEVHLRRSFRRDFGMAPVDYVQRLKLEKALSLLHQTDYLISQIAEMVGYQNAYYFSSAFHRIVGCTPTEYRRRIASCCTDDSH